MLDYDGRPDAGGDQQFAKDWLERHHLPMLTSVWRRWRSGRWTCASACGRTGRAAVAAAVGDGRGSVAGYHVGSASGAHHAACSGAGRPPRPPGRCHYSMTHRQLRASPLNSNTFRGFVVADCNRFHMRRRCRSPNPARPITRCSFTAPRPGKTHLIRRSAAIQPARYKIIYISAGLFVNHMIVHAMTNTIIAFAKTTARWTCGWWNIQFIAASRARRPRSSFTRSTPAGDQPPDRGASDCRRDTCSS